MENMADLRKKDPIQRVGSNERALRVGRLRVCGRAFLFVLVDSGFGRNQRESSALCGARLRALP